ncbi:MAG: LCP family protein, partial [Pseudonocardiales bacterium]|nr:LCP family protein [Pseudonocardiales bacterium]
SRPAPRTPRTSGTDPRRAAAGGTAPPRTPPPGESVTEVDDRTAVVAGAAVPRSKASRAAAARSADDLPERSVRPPTQSPPRRRPAPPPVRRTGRRRPRTLGRALLTVGAATVAPGAGHIMLNRRRTGGTILALYLATLVVLLVTLLTLRRSDLLATVLSGRALLVAGIGCVAAAVAWVTVIVRTWVLAQPRRLDQGRRSAGLAVVTVLCLLVAAPLGYAANLANSSRALLGDVFADSDGGATLDQPRINLLLVGSDAGPDRTGTRTDTMIVASVETATGRTTLFSLPRNIGRAPFPPGSPMAEEFPDGFHDDSDPNSGDYLLNAVYAYGHQFPEVAPAGPTADPGLNLMHQTISYMLGIPIDYYLELNMAGFASIIDALGGIAIDVGPERIPIGGISPSGRAVPPTGYIEPGFQTLDGEQALAFARSRTNSTDYVRMGRQRCLIQTILTQKSPTDLLTNFQEIAAATTGSVSTDIPQDVLPALVSLADENLALESVAFDPNLPDPEESDGRFNTADPNYELMREVVQQALATPAAAPSSAAAAPSGAPGTARADEDGDEEGSDASATDEPELTSAPLPVAQSC